MIDEQELNRRATKLKKTIGKLRATSNAEDAKSLYASMERQWKQIRLGCLPPRFSKKRTSRWMYI